MIDLPKLRYKQPMMLHWGTHTRKNVTTGYYLSADSQDIALASKISSHPNILQNAGELRGFVINKRLLRLEESKVFSKYSVIMNSGENLKRVRALTGNGREVLEVRYIEALPMSYYILKQCKDGHGEKRQYIHVRVIGRYHSITDRMLNLLLNEYSYGVGTIPTIDNITIPSSVISTIRLFNGAEERPLEG